MTVQMPLVPTAAGPTTGTEIATPVPGAGAEFTAVLDGMIPLDALIESADTPAAEQVLVPEAEVEVPPEEAPLTSEDEPEVEVDVAPEAEVAETSPVVVADAPVRTAIEVLKTPTAPKATDPIARVDDILPVEAAKVMAAPAPVAAPIPIETPQAAPIIARAAAAPVEPVKPPRPVVHQRPVAEVLESAAPTTRTEGPIRTETLVAAAPIVPLREAAPAPRGPVAAPVEPATPLRAAVADHVQMSHVPAPERPAPTAPPAPLAPVTPVAMATPMPPPALIPEPTAIKTDDAPLPEIERLSSDAPAGPTRAEQVQTVGTRAPLSAPHFARQIALSVLDTGDGQTEIQLKPEELGRLRLSITSHSDTAVTVMMAAERGETADLLRRHVADLEKDLLALGYTSIEFDFGDGAEAGESSDDTGFAERSEPQADTLTPAPQKRRVVVNSGLDIRL